MIYKAPVLFVFTRSLHDGTDDGDYRRDDTFGTRDHEGRFISIFFFFLNSKRRDRSHTQSTRCTVIRSQSFRIFLARLVCASATIRCTLAVSRRTGRREERARHMDII